MTQYEIIKKVRQCLKVNNGATVKQIAMATRISSQQVNAALKVMGDAYIDDYTCVGSYPIYVLIDKPKDAPKP